MITRNYFYIDYKQFVDIVKYRIYKMRHSVEEMIKKVTTKRKVNLRKILISRKWRAKATFVLIVRQFSVPWT